MKIERIEKKCPVCGKEVECNEIMSYSNFSSPNLDLKPIKSMLALGDEVQECPYCHYCNFDLSKPIEKRFVNHKDLWDNDEEIQEIIKNEQGATKKYMLVAKQFENNMDYENAYNTYIKASWVASSEKAKKLREDAIDIYIGYVLPNIRTKLMQMADIARQNGYHDVSCALLEATHNLLNEEDEGYNLEESIIHYEFELNDIQDIKPHNVDEIEINPHHHK